MTKQIYDTQATGAHEGFVYFSIERLLIIFFGLVPLSRGDTGNYMGVCFAVWHQPKLYYSVVY